MAININIPIDDELHSKLKIKAITSNITMKQLIINVLRKAGADNAKVQDIRKGVKINGK